MKRTSKVLAATLVLTMGLFGLSACSGGLNHEILDSGEECLSCHEEEPQTYELDSAPSSATDCGTTITVTTDAEEVYVCDPTFASEDGAKYVPFAETRVSVSDGQATVDLEEGVWAICIDNGDGSSKGVLVNASASNSEEVTIEL